MKETAHSIGCLYCWSLLHFPCLVFVPRSASTSARVPEGGLGQGCMRDTGRAFIACSLQPLPFLPGLGWPSGNVLQAHDSLSRLSCDAWRDLRLWSYISLWIESGGESPLPAYSCEEQAGPTEGKCQLLLPSGSGACWSFWAIPLQTTGSPLLPAVSSPQPGEGGGVVWATTLGSDN